LDDSFFVPLNLSTKEKGEQPKPLTLSYFIGRFLLNSWLF